MPPSTRFLPSQLYVAVSRPEQVNVYDTNAEGEVRLARVIGGPHTTIDGIGSIALDARGNVYVVNRSNVTVFDPTAEGDATPIRAVRGGFGSPQSIAIDSVGNLYVLYFVTGFDDPPGATDGDGLSSRRIHTVPHDRGRNRQQHIPTRDCNRSLRQSLYIGGWPDIDTSQTSTANQHLRCRSGWALHAHSHAGRRQHRPSWRLANGFRWPQQSLRREFQQRERL